MDKDEYTSRYSITRKFEYIVERSFDDAYTKTALQRLLDEEVEKQRGNINAELK